MSEAMRCVKVAEPISQVVMNFGLPLMRVSYDAAGDVLYVHFAEQPVSADDSEFIEDDVVVRYCGDEVVGVTILNASRRVLSGHWGGRMGRWARCWKSHRV